MRIRRAPVVPRMARAQSSATHFVTSSSRNLSSIGGPRAPDTLFFSLISLVAHRGAERLQGGHGADPIAQDADSDSHVVMSTPMWSCRRSGLGTVSSSATLALFASDFQKT